MSTTPNSIDLLRIYRRQAAYGAFLQGLSREEAARSNGIEVEELDEIIRLKFNSEIKSVI